MIDPTRMDIGRKVVYRDRSGHVCEEGVITSFNAHHVFARYGASAQSKGARREDLEWVSTERGTEP
jgi:hypothetical protein